MNDATGLLTPRRYRSGAIVIDPVQRRVVVDGEGARLGARAFDLLLVLLERRDRVVAKRELMELVWPRLVVEDNNLQVHVAALRKVLGPQAIATIPGRGYQFALAIDVLEPVVLPAATAAAAVAPGRDPGNLPSTAPLIGRAADIAAVDALLRDHRALTLVGAGGIGKTRLALAVAQAAASGRFPDGRWWIDMAALTNGDQMRQAIASTLGAAPVVARSDAALADAVAPLNALVVLDNCEHLVDVLAPLLDTMLAHAPGPRWLATSQESLKCSGEQVYRLGGLTVPEGLDLDSAAECGAVALFVERVHALDPRFRLGADNLAPVVEICRRLDGIPLAIEFAAARVPLLGARGVAERLDQRLDLLSGGSRMRLRRHQTLRAALEWSYSLLSDDEKRVFRGLGAFTGGFTLELAKSRMTSA